MAYKSTRGRPRKPEDQRRVCRIEVMLTLTEKNKLTSLADAAGLDASSYCRLKCLSQPDDFSHSNPPDAKPEPTVIDDSVPSNDMEAYCHTNPLAHLPPTNKQLRTGKLSAGAPKTVTGNPVTPLKPRNDPSHRDHSNAYTS